MKPCRTFISLAVAATAFVQSSSPLCAQVVPVFEITFRENVVYVEGASPGSEVVWFSIASESSDYASTTVPRSGVRSVDAGGLAAFELEEGLPPHSIWAAVDLANGGFAIATPPGYPLRQSALDPDAIKKDASGRVNRLTSSRSDLHLLLVRPGAGAWVGRFSEGAPDDADGLADGVLTAELLNLRALGATAQDPDEFSDGDVLVAIDPMKMDVIAVRLQD